MRGTTARIFSARIAVAMKVVERADNRCEDGERQLAADRLDREDNGR
jgi:hypothetical protein